MALFTITTVEQPAGPPNQVGNLTINLDFGVSHTFTADNFTTETTPVYLHPDGYAADKIKIVSLNITSPATLELNGVTVNVDDEINISDISQLVYTQQGTHTGYTDTFTFNIADDTSGEYNSGIFGEITIISEAQANQPPTVDDNSVTVEIGVTTVLTEDLFLNNYSDPEGNPPFKLKVLTVPTDATLSLSDGNGNSSIVTANTEILFTAIESGRFSVTSFSTAGTVTTFEFAVADSGSQQYST